LLQNPKPKRFVNMHDFSRANQTNQINWALQAAEKLNFVRFVTGHDFSRAE
jgi:hypothetical protein